METQNSTNHHLTPLSWSGMETVQNVHPTIDTVCPKSTEQELENRRENEFHDSRGKFAPGNPGGGRPKTTKIISDALKEALAAGKAEELSKTLLDLTKSADKDSVRLAAISEVADRTEGKAVQNVRHAGVFMVMAPGAEALAALDSWAEDE